MSSNDEQIGTHASRLSHNFGSRVSFTNDCLYGDPDSALRFRERFGIGEQLIAIDRRQHNWLEGHRAWPESRNGSRREDVESRDR
jgi:hypothetical protein